MIYVSLYWCTFIFVFVVLFLKEPRGYWEKKIDLFLLPELFYTTTTIIKEPRIIRYDITSYYIHMHTWSFICLIFVFIYSFLCRIVSQDVLMSHFTLYLFRLRMLWQYAFGKGATVKRDNNQFVGSWDWLSSDYRFACFDKNSLFMSNNPVCFWWLRTHLFLSFSLPTSFTFTGHVKSLPPKLNLWQRGVYSWNSGYQGTKT